MGFCSCIHLLLRKWRLLVQHDDGVDGKLGQLVVGKLEQLVVGKLGQLVDRLEFVDKLELVGKLGQLVVGRLEFELKNAKCMI